MTDTLDDLTLYAGTKRTLTMIVYDGAGGDVLDLTNRTVTWQMGVFDGDGVLQPDAVLAKTAEITSAVDGQCQVVLLTEDTARIDPGLYWQEWEVRDSDGEGDVIAVGRVRLQLNLR